MSTTLTTALVIIFMSISTSFAAVVPAQEGDLSCLRLAGMKDVKVGTLWDNTDPRIAGPACAAKKYLISLPRGWAKSSKVDAKSYTEESIAALNPEFAQCVASFVKAYRTKYGASEPVTLTSAFRSPCQEIQTCEGEEGLCGVKKGVNDKEYERMCKEYEAGTYKPKDTRPSHGNGTAVDIWPFSLADVQKYSTADKSLPVALNQVTRFHTFAAEFARSNPKQGVHFRLGMKDRPHLEPMPGVCGHGKGATFSPKPSFTTPEGAQQPGTFQPAAGADKASPFGSGSLQKMLGSFMPKGLGGFGGGASKGSSGGGGTSGGGQQGGAQQGSGQSGVSSPFSSQQQFTPQQTLAGLSPLTSGSLQTGQSASTTKPGTISEDFTDGEDSLRELQKKGTEGAHTVGPTSITYQGQKFTRVSGTCSTYCSIVYKPAESESRVERILIAAMPNGTVVYRYRDSSKNITHMDTEEFRLP